MFTITIQCQGHVTQVPDANKRTCHKKNVGLYKYIHAATCE